MRGRREWRQEYDDPLDRQLNVIPNDAILKINYCFCIIKGESHPNCWYQLFIIII